MANRIFTGGNTDNSGGLTQGDVFDFKRLYEKTILINEDVSVTINEPTTISGSLSSSSLSTGAISSGTINSSTISSTGNISATGSITTNGTIGVINSTEFRGENIQLDGTSCYLNIDGPITLTGTNPNIFTNGIVGNAGQANFRGRDIEVNGTSYFAEIRPTFIQCNGSIATVATGSNGRGFILADDGDIVDNNDGFATMRFTQGVAITAGKNNNTQRILLKSNGSIDVSNTITTLNAGTTHNIQGNMNLSGNLGVGGDLTSTGTVRAGVFRATYFKGTTTVTGNDSSELYLNLDDALIKWGPQISTGTIRPYELRFESNGGLRYVGKYPDGLNNEQERNILLGEAAPSDIRLKTNIEQSDTSKTLDQVIATSIVHFDWKDKRYGKEREMGFIAQDIEQRWPEVIESVWNGELEGGKKTLDKGRLVPMAFAAIQELKKQLDEAVKQIDDLKKQIT